MVSSVSKELVIDKCAELKWILHIASFGCKNTENV